MNIPNFLTILRILLVPVFINLLIYGYHISALIVFLLAGLTDGLDGFIARISNKKTTLGTYLDPMADKLLLAAGFITLTKLHLVPVWLTIIILSRDAILLIGTLMIHLIHEAFNISPTIIGKGTTLFQLVYIVSVLVSIETEKVSYILPPLALITTILTISSGLHYIYRGIVRINSKEAR
jgi:cardiolipin synthase